jgi:hypothetical protein
MFIETRPGKPTLHIPRTAHEFGEWLVAWIVKTMNSTPTAGWKHGARSSLTRRTASANKAIRWNRISDNH